MQNVPNTISAPEIRYYYGGGGGKNYKNIVIRHHK